MRRDGCRAFQISDLRLEVEDGESAECEHDVCRVISDWRAALSEKSPYRGANAEWRMQDRKFRRRRRGKMNFWGIVTGVARSSPVRPSDLGLFSVAPFGASRLAQTQRMER